MGLGAAAPSTLSAGLVFLAVAGLAEPGALALAAKITEKITDGVQWHAAEYSDGAAEYSDGAAEYSDGAAEYSDGVASTVRCCRV